MYLFLGQNVVVPKTDVIGVFDLDNCTGSRITRDFLRRREAAGEVVDVSGELPRSFVLCQPPVCSLADRQTVQQALYLSQLNSSTLLRRWDNDSGLSGSPKEREQIWIS